MANVAQITADESPGRFTKITRESEFHANLSPSEHPIRSRVPGVADAMVSRNRHVSNPGLKLVRSRDAAPRTPVALLTFHDSFLRGRSRRACLYGETAIEKRGLTYHVLRLGCRMGEARFPDGHEAERRSRRAVYNESQME